MRLNRVVASLLIFALDYSKVFSQPLSYSDCILSKRPNKVAFLSSILSKHEGQNSHATLNASYALGMIHKDDDFSVCDKFVSGCIDLDIPCNRIAKTQVDELNLAWPETRFRNPELAYKYLKQSSELGNWNARAELALLYAAGDGVPKDLNYALKLGLESAVQGVTKAQEMVGNIYAGQGFLFNGELKGLPPNNILSYMWLNVAAVSGSEDARKSRDYISSRLSPAQISEAQAISRRCIETELKICREWSWWDWIFGL